VSVAGTLLVKGYQVLDPGTGAVIRRDERAAAVWTYTDALLDVSCRTPLDCELTAHEPASGDEMWRVGLPGIGFVLFADNPDLAKSRPITADRIHTQAAPTRMPSLLGFPVDGKVQVVDTGEGKVLPSIDPDRQDHIVVLGGRVLHSAATPRDGGCAFTLTARDAVTGEQVWHRDGYQLRTISGGGCEQRKQPAGSGNALVAVRPDGAEVLIDAADGREVLVCAVGEKVLATDGVYAVVRSADGAQISGYALGSAALGKLKPLWTRKADAKASASVTRTAVVIVDRGPDRVIVLDPKTGRVRAEARSGAKVLAIDDAGLLLSEQRDLGYLPFG
jgi:outer membrane protein assembly factor BamB